MKPKKKLPLVADNLGPQVTGAPVGSAAEAALPIYSARIAHTQTISGPIPPPEMLGQYEMITAGTADRLLRLAGTEPEHRRKVELQVIDLQCRDQRAFRLSELLGQVFGLIIGCLAIIGAVIVALHGYKIAASLLGTTGVTGLVTAFITGRTLLLKQKRQEFEQMTKMQDVQNSPGVGKSEPGDRQ